MFYSQFILAKKGPLGTIWIAAHLERKLRKNQVADTDIGVSVDSILFPEMPIALRLSSHLLLGVVRIYSRKVNYLFDDCSEALLKVKQAFRSTAVDLPPEESTAPYHSITLPETFDLDDFELPDTDIFQSNYVDHHVSSRDQITLQDTMEGVVYSTSKFGLDERFGDGDASGLDLDEELVAEKDAAAGHANVTTSFDLSSDPQASVQARAPLKGDENQDDGSVSEAIMANGGVNQMEDFDGDNEPIEYAQAPCTPGLWEEPNLSNIQETSACDDHQEPDNHNVTESAANEKLENASGNTTEFVPHEQEDNRFEPPEKLAPAIVATEHKSTDDLDSTRFNNPLSPKPELLDTIINTTGGPEGVENLQNDNAVHHEPGAQSADNSHENLAELQGLAAAENLKNASPLSIQLESNAEPLGEANLDNLENQALQEPQDSKISTLSDSIQCSDYPVPTLCATRLNQSDTNDDTQANPIQLTDVASLPPIASQDSTLMQGEASHGTKESELTLQETHYTSDFPAAEKLLSVPERVSEIANDLQLETTPAHEDMVMGDVMLTGKKRSFTESSLMAQSFNLVESSGLFNTKITAQSVPDDNDLLSSILVGRSSVLKVKPTPPLEMPTKRRRQSAPRTTGASKRKVLVDDNMVLHGDLIRQQLTNTEDIRRLRKKAPCTQAEISMLQKQFWEDELFDEPVFTGLSIKLASLHHQAYDLSKIRVSRSAASSEGVTDLKFVSQNDENGNEKLDASLEPNVVNENECKANFNPLATEDVQEAEPFETPQVPGNQPYENNRMNSYYYGSQEQMHATSEAKEPIDLEHEVYALRTAMEIDGKTFSASDIGNSIVPFEACTTEAVQSDTCDMSTALAPVEETTEPDKSLQMDAPTVRPDEKTDLPSVDLDSSNHFETNIGEIKIDIGSTGAEVGTNIESLTGHTDDLESGPVANACSTFSSDIDGLREHIATLDQAMEAIGKNEDKALQPEVAYDAMDLVPNGISGEELACNREVDSGSKDILLEDKEIPGYQDAYPADTMNMEDISAKNRVDEDKEILGYQDAYPAETTNMEDMFANNKVDGDELEYSAVGNDTDFLNFDDDDDDNEEAEAAGDYLPNTEAKRVIDNSGWSSRTKAVAKYLQIMFDKEGERGIMALRMNNLLTGKTRKEASRMFFETLVLKTKDYIHVEQTDPFENIDIMPRSKLLKSDF